MNPFVLGIIGDSGSGKTTVADAVATLLGPARVADLRLDDYHRFTREERAERGLTALNPMVQNVPLMEEHLQLLRRGRPIRNRSYNHADGTFGPIRTIDPRDFVLVRGLVGYPTDALREAYDLAVFLHPESELLFRWKLRRDVRSRGYTEAEVLKSIAHHLLDAKQFVLPQADRADLLVHYELPDWEAPDARVQTVLVLRRRAAEAAGAAGFWTGLGAGVHAEHRGDELLVRLDQHLGQVDVDRWGSAGFPRTFSSERTGIYLDDEGVPRHRPQLAVVEILIARLAVVMR